MYNFLDRVLSPVLEALVPMKTDIQQNVGRIVLKTFCDAWLEHIQSKKIKFRLVYFCKLFLIIFDNMGILGTRFCIFK